LILAIRLQLFLVRRLVLGADQGVRRSLSFGREIQVALVLPYLLFEVATAILPHAETVHRLVRVFQKSPQFRAVRALARNCGDTTEVGGFSRGFRGQMLQLLAARGNPERKQLMSVAYAALRHPE
jgi:hypothetical protein